MKLKVASKQFANLLKGNNMFKNIDQADIDKAILQLVQKQNSS